MDDENKKLYTDCFQKQLEEIDLLCSIFCNPGEIHIDDPKVISDFHEFIEGKTNAIHNKMDFSVYINYNNEKIDLRVALPHLYPKLETANVTLRTSLLSKSQDIVVKQKIENYIDSLDKSEPYVFQIITWIQDQLENFLQIQPTDPDSIEQKGDNCVDVERLWIYSHHIKSKMKRQEIINQAQSLDLTGFSRPGKPGIICVEGLKENTQEFWRIIRSLRWQKITVKRSECKRKADDKVDEWRRFSDFKEELFTDVGSEVMNMSMFIKFLDAHKCGYMKQELFGFE